jgi:hypothetical protein
MSGESPKHLRIDAIEHKRDTHFIILQVVFEFPLHKARQHPAFLGQLLPENRVMLRHQLIK